MDAQRPSVEKLTGNDLIEARKKSLAEFGNIEHRLELVDLINGVEYVNDSKATDVNSTWYSLDVMEAGVVWILGASIDETDYDLFSEIALDKVRAIIFLGQPAQQIVDAFLNRVNSITRADTVEMAVNIAASIADSGSAVLFSPACSSFDLFQNYKDRGEQFRKAVNALNT